MFDIHPDRCKYCGTEAHVLRALFDAENGILKSQRKRGASLELERRDATAEHNRYESDNCAMACYVCNNHKSDFISETDHRRYFAPVIHKYLMAKNEELNGVKHSSLSPTLSTPFVVGDLTIEIPRCRILLDRWQGETIKHTFGNKPLIDVGGKPMFAELAIMQLFLDDGWEARWLESYAHGQRNIVVLQEWADLPYSQQTDSPIENREIVAMLAAIAKENGGNFGGCWDVLAWKGDRLIFAETKRIKQDRINDNQRRWVAAALRYGLKPENFLVVEWDLKNWLLTIVPKTNHRDVPALYLIKN